MFFYICADFYLLIVATGIYSHCQMNKEIELSLYRLAIKKWVLQYTFKHTNDGPEAGRNVTKLYYSFNITDFYFR